MPRNIEFGLAVGSLYATAPKEEGETCESVFGKCRASRLSVARFVECREGHAYGHPFVARVIASSCLPRNPQTARQVFLAVVLAVGGGVCNVGIACKDDL